MPYRAEHIEAAVRSICPDIRQRVIGSRRSPDERTLWWELSSCILSSQVPYSLAAAAADALDRSEVLLEPRGVDALEARIHELLLRPLAIDGRTRRYRFPAGRARQLASTHGRIVGEAGSLARLLSGFPSAEEAREWFVMNASGVGPKQASMFLRNAGFSYELAVLDRHVLDYMVLTGLQRRDGCAPQTLARYRRTEKTLRGHAEAATCPVGIMDWAIWIVMRLVKLPVAVSA